MSTIYFSTNDQHTADITIFLFVSKVFYRINQMARAKSKLMPGIPHHIEEVIFEGSWRETWHGNRFIFHQDNDWGIVIFATHANMTALSKCQQLYMDATFGTPEAYDQMFNILGDYHGRVIPMVTALTLTNRTIGHYRQVLQRIKCSVGRVTRHD